MTTKYHVAADGTVKPCKAKVKPCPLGGGHFDSVKEAVAYLDNKYSHIEKYKMNVSLGAHYSPIHANKRGLFVDQETKIAIEDGKETHILYRDKNKKWKPERAKMHEEILTELMDKYKSVPSDRKVVFSAGLPGAGKTTVLTQYENLDVNNWATVSSDDFKEILAERGYVPEIEGLTPMEASTLVHEESSYLADELLKRLGNEGKNIIYDFTCKNKDTALERIEALKKYNYQVENMQFVFVDIPIDTAKERAKGRYRFDLNKGIENDHNNQMLVDQGKPSEQKKTMGGRFLPEEIITSSKSINGRHSSVNAETLIELHTSELGLPEPIVYNNEGIEPVKRNYGDFLIGV